jgi:hypothetical protein
MWNAEVKKGIRNVEGERIKDKKSKVKGEG